MTIIVSGVNESVQVLLDSAPATNQLPCSASYADQLASGGDATVNTNGTTAVTLVASPSAGVSRVINGINIPNTDTATHIVTVNKVVSGTSYQMKKVSLLPGYQLGYGGGRWYVTDGNGAIQGTGTAGGTGPAGTSLTRPSANVSVASGVATVDISGGAEVWILPQLTANITSWVFPILPAATKYADLSIITQQGALTTYAIANPATTGHTYGGAWSNSLTLNAFETLGIRLWSNGTIEMFPSGPGV